ncbi:MAG: YHYH protein [Chitinophagales bacterium]|nr:YHYH protein [Chitinophagales bacterium]
MVKFISFLSTFLFAFITLVAQVTDPAVTSWIQTPGQTGYGGYASNVQQVQYTNTDVYVTCTCIPGYDVGPWAGNPNIPANQNFCFKITRNPQQNTGTKTATPLGHVGVWTNGVSIFNARDAISYNNQNVWHQDALPNEGSSFDNCLGHPAPNGEYHHHVNPQCLYDYNNSSVHSPIIGYAFDGFPIYGAFGYTNTNGTGAITRMKTGYRLRSISTRTTLPDGSTAASAGPVVSAQNPLGKYLEDYEYVQGLGDLDEHNGRFCVTPEYPNGIYAYFVTVDEDLNPVYPYTVGPTYYGTVQQGNTGPQSGHNTVPSGATTYQNITAINDIALIKLEVFPSPVSNFLTVNMSSLPASSSREVVIRSVGWFGNTMDSFSTSDEIATIPVESYPSGIYLVRVTDGSGATYKKPFVKL